MSFPDIGEVTDDFYYDSSELFSDIVRHLQLRLGVYTRTVELEANDTLAKAILNALEEKVSDRSELFKRMSLAWNLCEEKMRTLRSYLLREEIDESEIMAAIPEINRMYGELRTRCRKRAKLKAEAKSKVKVEMKGAAKRHKSISFGIYLEQMLRDNLQLERLARNPPSPVDRRILAEAVVLRKRYKDKIGADVQMYMASCDSNNFSCAKSKWGLSMPVTDAISKKYQIKCEWPREISNFLRTLA